MAVLRDSIVAARFGAPLAGALPVNRARLADAAAVFPFKRMDLRTTDRAAAFFVTLDFDFAFIAISRAEL
jgi:hypothetical protein